MYCFHIIALLLVELLLAVLMCSPTDCISILLLVNKCPDGVVAFNKYDRYPLHL
jgi:hypothetical protein